MRRTGKKCAVLFREVSSWQQRTHFQHESVALDKNGMSKKDNSIAIRWVSIGLLMFSFVTALCRVTSIDDFSSHSIFMFISRCHLIKFIFETSVTEIPSVMLLLCSLLMSLSRKMPLLSQRHNCQCFYLFFFSLIHKQFYKWSKIINSLSKRFNDFRNRNEISGFTLDLTDTVNALLPCVAVKWKLK